MLFYSKVAFFFSLSFEKLWKRFEKNRNSLRSEVKRKPEVKTNISFRWNFNISKAVCSWKETDWTLETTQSLVGNDDTFGGERRDCPVFPAVATWVILSAVKATIAGPWNHSSPSCWCVRKTVLSFYLSSDDTVPLRRKVNTCCS